MAIKAATASANRRDLSSSHKICEVGSAGFPPPPPGVCASFQGQKGQGAESSWLPLSLSYRLGEGEKPQRGGGKRWHKWSQWWWQLGGEEGKKGQEETVPRPWEREDGMQRGRTKRRSHFLWSRPRI